MVRILVLVQLLALVLLGCEAEDPGALKPLEPRARKPARGDPLLEPECAEMNLVAPPTFRAAFSTSQGTIVIEVNRAWAPNGADRFYSLVKNGFFDRCRIFRVVPDWVAQWGIHGTPKISAAWEVANIPDDPVLQSNEKGTVCFATAGPGTRTTQVFINLKDNTDALDVQGFSPFGKVVKGMAVVEKLYDGYGDDGGPDQARLQREGNAYLGRDFPMLDYIVKATILDG